ncbi:MAG: hypothetical protein M1281_09980, partial [Chloroflexi bacterium]|nr:hypothetical protein [Chloroflexota bacterium]
MLDKRSNYNIERQEETNAGKTQRVIWGGEREGYDLIPWRSDSFVKVYRAALEPQGNENSQAISAWPLFTVYCSVGADRAALEPQGNENSQAISAWPLFTVYCSVGADRAALEPQGNENSQAISAWPLFTVYCSVGADRAALEPQGNEN